MKHSIELDLEALTKRSPIVVFMKGLPSHPRCGFSRQICLLLDKYNVPYDAYDILTNEEVSLSQAAESMDRNPESTHRSQERINFNSGKKYGISSQRIGSNRFYFLPRINFSQKQQSLEKHEFKPVLPSPPKKQLSPKQRKDLNKLLSQNENYKEKLRENKYKNFIPNYESLEKSTRKKVTRIYVS
jgi:hypothetical protein